MIDTYTPFVLDLTVEDGPQTDALVVREDGSIVVNWEALETYASISPVTRRDVYAEDFTARCMALAVLAVRDGRVTEA